MASFEIPFEKRNRLFKHQLRHVYVYFSEDIVYLVNNNLGLVFSSLFEIELEGYINSSLLDYTVELPLELLLTSPSKMIRDWAKGMLDE